MEAMVCSKCGATMNHHADKIDARGSAEASLPDASWGQIVEMHTCPACGNNATRAGR